MSDATIKSFTDLKVWRESPQLTLDVYRLTRNFPDVEKFWLVSQLRRACVSITSNVVEGFSRFSNKEKVYFYTKALGSLTEVQNQLFLSRDLGFLSTGDFESLAQRTVAISKMLNGLIKKTKSRDS